MGACLIGFDLRLVGEFAARPEVDEGGSASFKLTNGVNDNVLGWWRARNSVKERVRAFSGVDPTSDMVTILINEESEMSQAASGEEEPFIEGGKKPNFISDTST